MARTIAAVSPIYEYNAFTQLWRKVKQPQLVNALEQLVAWGYEDEFGLPPYIHSDHLGVRILRLGHLDSDQLEELQVRADRIYLEIMRDREDTSPAGE